MDDGQKFLGDKGKGEGHFDRSLVGFFTSKFRSIALVQF
jgi:hypothetical protein